MKISVADAKNKLADLIKAVEAGESVTICRRGVPVVDLVPTKTHGTKRPIFGSLKDRITINDVNWWKPMTEDEVESFVDGQRAIVKLYNDLKVIW
ncbi:MAG: type II toxin-antitoxin system prevent-host-death family antitoxin [Candidatus Obscuribacterales bacterium]